MTEQDEYAGIADPYAVSASVLRPASQVLIDGKAAADYLRCVHCGGHFMVMKGSGIERGWCGRCSGPTCGHACCHRCVPWKRQLELIEKRASREYRLGV